MNTRSRRVCQASLCALLGIVLPVSSLADAVRREVEGDSSRQIIHMTVTPADEPTPPFRYRLTLLPHEKTPGNSVAHYMRAFAESSIERTWRRLGEKHGDELDLWYSEDIPTSQLPLDRMAEAVRALNDYVENYVDPGSRRRETDWGTAYEDVKGEEVISFLLPEVQGMRSISRAISLLTRHAIAERRYDDALDLLRMNYRLGRDVSQQPLLVSGLVGVSISSVASSNVVDLVAAPDSPNLYWALTELPSPHISLREALRLELAIGPRMFEILDNPSEMQRTDSEWNALWKKTVNEFYAIMGPSHGPTGLVRSDFSPLASGFAGYAHAKERLVAWGRDPGQVEAMAVGQVLAIYSARVYETIADQYEKAVYFDPQTNQRLVRAASSLENHHDSPNRELLPIAGTLLPATRSIQISTFRLQRNIDALRVIEALRMHAAQNEGAWPASLNDITCVPVPKNVATGEPFEYQVEGDTAVLLLPSSDGLHRDQRYELTLASGAERSKNHEGHEAHEDP